MPPTNRPGQTAQYAQVLTGLLRIGAIPFSSRASFLVQAIDVPPNGSLVGSPPDLAMQSDGTLWQKQSGENTDSGWAVFVTPGGSSGGAEPPYGLKITGLNAARTGSVDTSVLRFSGSPVADVAAFPVADWVEVTTTAENGTRFRLIRPGRYVAALSTLDSAGAPGNASTIGLSIDAANLTATPIISLAGFRATASHPDLSTPMFISCSAPFLVTQAMIDAAQGIFRAHGVPATTLSLTFTGMVLVDVGGIGT